MNTNIKTWVTGIVFTLFSFIAISGMAGDDIAVSDLPKAVTSAIMKRYPGTKIIKAERERDNSKVHYEVNIQTGDKRMELNVRPDGTIYKVEKEDDDDDGK